MTFEELKAEAEKQGYSLIKKQPFFGFRYDGFNCGICGKESLSRKGASEREKIKDWNKKVQ